MYRCSDRSEGAKLTHTLDEEHKEISLSRPWEIDPKAEFHRRLGKSALELGTSRTTPDCPDLWELSNGDVAVVGRDATELYAQRLPKGMSVGADERLVVVPGAMLRAAKKDIPDA